MNVLLLVIVIFYIIPIITVKYFNRWTSISNRMLDNPPSGENLVMSFCPVVNIIVACMIFTNWILDVISRTSNTNSGKKVINILKKIIT